MHLSSETIRERRTELKGRPGGSIVPKELVAALFALSPSPTAAIQTFVRFEVPSRLEGPLWTLASCDEGGISVASGSSASVWDWTHDRPDAGFELGVCQWAPYNSIAAIRLSDIKRWSAGWDESSLVTSEAWEIVFRGGEVVRFALAEEGSDKEKVQAEWIRDLQRRMAAATN